jgi:hypothetical protein
MAKVSSIRMTSSTVSKPIILITHQESFLTFEITCPARADYTTGALRALQ